MLLANVRKVSAANISDTITSPDTTDDVRGTTNNISGSLGPLEFRLTPMRMKEACSDTANFAGSYCYNAGSFNFDNADLIHKNCYCASFCKVSPWYSVNSTQSDTYRFSTVLTFL